MEKFHHNGEIPSSKSVTQMMEFLQVKSPFIGVMCNPTVAIATKNILWSRKDEKKEEAEVSK